MVFLSTCTIEFVFYLAMSLGLLIFIIGALRFVGIGDECDGDKKNK